MKNTLKNYRIVKALVGFTVKNLVAFISLGLAFQVFASYEYEYFYSPGGKILAEVGPDGEAAGVDRTAKRYLYELSDRPTLVTAIEYGVVKFWPDPNDPNNAPSTWSSSDFEVVSVDRVTYDNYGRKSFSGKTDKYGNYESLKQYSYDSRSRVDCETVRMNKNILTPAQSPSSACQLGSEGNQGEDRITKYVYDGLDNVQRIWKALGTDQQQSYAIYTYNGKKISTVKDANGNLSKFEYDNFGRPSYFYYPSKVDVGKHSGEDSDPADDYERYGYDNNGNRTSWRKRSGKYFYYSYDALNRNYFKNVPNTTAKDVYYIYELTGVNTSATFGSYAGQGVFNEFNGFGDVLESTTTMNGSNRTVSSTFDKHGNRVYLRHPYGAFFHYSFDQRDQNHAITRYSSNLVDFDFDGLGRIDTVQRNPSRTGAQTSFDYDDVSRLQSFTHDFKYTSNDLTNSYQYNPASQVTQLDYSNNLYHYIGNDYRVGDYEVNGLNQYTTVAGDTLGYDNNGNLAQNGTGATYTFDEENRLISVSGDVSATLTYDPLGRLFEIYIISFPSSKRQFVYDGDALIAEFSSSTDTAADARYVHGVGADVPVLQYNTSSIYYTNQRYLHANHQGSIVAHSDYYGNVTLTNTYDAFGIPEVGNAGRFGYTGQMWLPELGLYHYKARMYEPRLGRFLQTDPVGYEDQMNLYAYVHNDPLNMVDPAGMQSTRAEWFEELGMEDPNAGLANKAAQVGDAAATAGDVVDSVVTPDATSLAGPAGKVIGAAAIVVKVTKGPLWTSTKSKSAVENAFGHYKKHKGEFPEFQNAKQYVEGTQKFLNSPPKGTLTKTRSNGDTLLYDPKTNTFGVKDADGTPRTMFRPKDGMDYWNKQ